MCGGEPLNQDLPAAWFSIQCQNGIFVICCSKLTSIKHGVGHLFCAGLTWVTLYTAAFKGVAAYLLLQPLSALPSAADYEAGAVWMCNRSDSLPLKLVLDLEGSPWITFRGIFSPSIIYLVASISNGKSSVVCPIPAGWILLGTG